MDLVQRYATDVRVLVIEVAVDVVQGVLRDVLALVEPDVQDVQEVVIQDALDALAGVADVPHVLVLAMVLVQLAAADVMDAQVVVTGVLQVAEIHVQEGAQVAVMGALEDVGKVVTVPVSVAQDVREGVNRGVLEDVVILVQADVPAVQDVPHHAEALADQDVELAVNQDALHLALHPVQVPAMGIALVAAMALLQLHNYL